MMGLDKPHILSQASHFVEVFQMLLGNNLDYRRSTQFHFVYIRAGPSISCSSAHRPA